MTTETEKQVAFDKIDWTPARRKYFMERVLEAAQEAGDYAGVPVPWTKFRVLLAPGAKASRVAEMVSDESQYRFAPASDSVHRTVMLSKGIVLIRFKDSEGKLHIYRDGIAAQRFELYIEAMSARRSCLADAEWKAMQRLMTMLSEEQREDYVLSASFAERGRSNVLYGFRKGLPTLAIAIGEEAGTPLAALCLHPLGYYEGTHAGVLAPSDDVIAALLMMRSDEKFFWRKANQISPQDPLAAM